ncbi:hypothetical protein AGLY_007410 [Aphis glycines]|uniref:Uncharacterized protein n=1 Tax=Aphis glycines TaxID=307491 RepID=A0A6G0TNJ3_APHGL|nr:hypothetical protein AGLY_007410 [Aphis glycines]
MGIEASELSEFLKITQISVYYENEQLVFITRIPLVFDVELSLYNIISIPIKFVEDGVDSWYISTTTYTYVAITKDRKQFTTYTEKEIKDCIETAIYRICKATQPMIDNNDNTPCELQIFKAPDAFQTGCNINKFPLVRNIYHRILNKNTWIHVGDDTLTISCTDLPKIVRSRSAITILDINCQVFTRNAVLTPIEDISSTNYKDFVPTTKIQNIFNKIPEHIHKYKLSDVWNNTSNIQLTDLHSVSRSLDEIQQMIDEEVIREQSQKHQFIHSNLLKETHKFIIMDFEFSMVKRTSIVVISGAISNSLEKFEVSKLEGRPLLLPIDEKARPMIEKELQVAVKEIKRIFVCKTELQDACLDQLKQSLNSTRNNLTREYIDHYIRQGNKENNIIVVWNGHSDKTILQRLNLDYPMLNITCYDKYFNKNFFIQFEKLSNREIIFEVDIGKFDKTGRLLNLVETHDRVCNRKHKTTYAHDPRLDVEYTKCIFNHVLQKQRYENLIQYFKI